MPHVIVVLAILASLIAQPLRAQSAALQARFDSLHAAATDRLADLDAAAALPLGREMVRVARRIDDPQRELTGWLVVASAQLTDFSPAMRQAAGYALDTAVAVIERARRAARTPAERLALLERQAEVFDLWVHGIAERGGQGDGGVEETFYAMLAAADRGRARLLAESLGADRESAEEVAVDRARLVTEGQRLHALARRSNASVISYLASPSRLLVLYSGPDGSMNIASTAIADTTLAALVAEARSTLGVDAASPAGARALAEGLSGTRGVIGRAAGRADTAAVRRLSAILLPERILSAIGAARRRDVIVIPHRSVAMVPFAALPLPSGEPSGAIFAYRYAPSLSVLDAVERRITPSLFDTTAAHSGIVVGDPAMPRVRTAAGNLQLDALPGARREAAWVAERFGIRPMTGEQATESTVREAMVHSTIIHLATHGFAYADVLRESESFIALAADSSSDGLLQVRELEAAPGMLNADLVVLSACQTGLGSTRLSEGTIGLPRAFLTAGARTVLVSLWSVSDEATELLMQRFYAHWLGGGGQRTKAQALWRAQNDLRADSRFAAPRYWAAFQLVGGA